MKMNIRTNKMNKIKLKMKNEMKENENKDENKINGIKNKNKIKYTRNKIKVTIK